MWEGMPLHRGCGQILGRGPRDTRFLAVQNSTTNRNQEEVLGRGLHWHSCLGLQMPAAALSRGEPGCTVGGEETKKSKKPKTAKG